MFYFTLTLPLAEGRQFNTIETSPLEVDYALPTGARVLLVDDEEMNRFFGSKLISSLDVDVVTAASGDEALSLLADQSFDVVLMDVSMPEMDGYETTRRIRADAQRKEIPVIALTAHAIPGERERCLASGMNDYVTKPFEVGQLLMVMSRYAR